MSKRIGRDHAGGAETGIAFASRLAAAIADGADERPNAAVAVLADEGQLARFCVPKPDGGYRYDASWRDVFDLLAGIGGVDLAAARLMEGHLNALQLIALYGDAEQQTRTLAAVREGGMLGVWGADGAEPLRLAPAGGRGWVLSGAKRYASGAGLLKLALVPVNDPDGPTQLLLLGVDDPARVDDAVWDMRGMRRSISGTYDFTGLAVTSRERVGEPDDYKREPYFVGGIWRCAAAQIGAVEAIVATIAGELAKTGRDGHPLQMERIGKAIIAARSARLWVEDAAERIESMSAEDGRDAIARAVALSAYGRLVTEDAAMTVIALAERALGLASFALGHPAEALTRDLAVYIRQANPDAVLLQHGRVLAENLIR